MDVCVVILCYNHEKFIAQAIDSVLMQKTNYNFKILISDDGSTDKTVSILDTYKQKYPQKITLLKNDSNKGVRFNVFKMMEATDASYTALLDGDDFWSHDEKLQEQVHFLENNKDYVGAYHDAIILHQDLQSKSYLFTNLKSYSQSNFYKTDTYPSDIIKRLIIPTSSIIFRTEALNQVDKSYLADSFSVAWKLTFFLTLSSKLRYFNETWSQYRNHNKGISKKNEENFYLSHIHFLKSLLKERRFSFLKKEINESISHQYLNYFNLKKELKAKIKLVVKIDYILTELKVVYLKIMNINKS